MNNTTQNKDNDPVAAFAGISILFSVLAIIFGVSAGRENGNTSNGVSNVPTSAVLIVVAEPSAEFTEALIVATEPTVEATEVLEQTVEETPEIVLEEATSEATEITVILEPSPEVTAESSTVVYSPELIAQGEALYVTCSACHGADGRGIPGLGKDLVAGEFVLTSSDEDLVAFIMTGRPIWDAANTTGMDMPARGGNPALTETDVTAIVAYLRSLQSPSADTSLVPEETLTTSSYSPELIAEGEALFVTCSGCHGADARGIAGLGKDLVAGEFVLTSSDEDLFNLIITGRPIWDAANTTGIDMPARGGNPALSDDNVMAIIAYLRSLQN